MLADAKRKELLDNEERRKKEEATKSTAETIKGTGTVKYNWQRCADGLLAASSKNNEVQKIWTEKIVRVLAVQLEMVQFFF